MAAAKKGLSFAAGAPPAAADDDWADEMAEAIASGDVLTIADELRKLEARCKAALPVEPVVEGAEV